MGFLVYTVLIVMVDLCGIYVTPPTLIFMEIEDEFSIDFRILGLKSTYPLAPQGTRESHCD